MNNLSTVNENAFVESIKSNVTLTIVFGILLILLGTFAMGAPFVAGISVVFVTGCSLLTAGILQVFYGIKNSKQFTVILSGLLHILMGGFMIANPGQALEVLTVFLVFYLIFYGIAEAIMSFQIRPTPGWVWTLFSGVMSVILGIMIWKQFPFSGLWTIGFLIGIKLVFSGWTLLLLGFATKRELKQAAL